MLRLASSTGVMAVRIIHRPTVKSTPIPAWYLLGVTCRTASRLIVPEWSGVDRFSVGAFVCGLACHH